MSNIGEDFTSIYLRLNGFLQITNFVIHKTEADEKGECDILALRTRNMKEIIYSNTRSETIEAFDYSNEVLGHRELNKEKDIYLWVEVSLAKEIKQKYITNKFTESKCKYVIERLGIQGWVDLDKIIKNPFLTNDLNDKLFAKILVYENELEGDPNLCLYTNIGYIQQQLKNWFEEYREIKKSDWYIWVNPIIQGLAKQMF